MNDIFLAADTMRGCVSVNTKPRQL